MNDLIFFGANILEEDKGTFKAIFGIENEGGASSYLGLPECFSGSKVEMLSYIKDAVKGRLSGWYVKSLSQGGKEVLLKAVLSAMPVFVMTCFKLPKTICDYLKSAMAEFWWSSVENKRKNHWIAWDRMCLSKHQGGMGFRDLECFNQALLAKQAWRILSAPDSLFSQVIKSRYFKAGEFLEAPMGARPSFAWRSIQHGKDLFIKGLKQRVGNGKSLSVWSDKWLEDDGMRSPWIKKYSFNVLLMVNELIDQSTKAWDPSKLEEIFVPGDIQNLLKHQPVVSKEDFKVWEHTTSGAYSVKSGYEVANILKNEEIIRLASMLPSINTLKVQIWKFEDRR